MRRAVFLGRISRAALATSACFFLAGCDDGGSVRGHDAGVGDGASDQPTDGGKGGSGGSGSANTTVKSTHKLDLLLMVDNSIAMADKQVVLKGTIADLVTRLTAASSGFTDVHIGVVTSSIGSHGGDVCVGKDGTGQVTDEENDDHAWLVGSRPRYAALTAQPEYASGLHANSDGFIAWNTAQGTAGLQTGIQGMVIAADEFGCGLESQLEAVYRFLVDPAPYTSITTVACGANKCATPVGVDSKLLAQRAAFLRPDSAVAIVDLSDENDCSIRESGIYYYAARTDIVPPGTQECAANPNDPCCYSCGASAPTGCPDETSYCATATAAQNVPSNHLDELNLRCFNEKKRFGLDFLYPTARYVNAFTQAHICAARADLDPTNCSSAPSPADAGEARTPIVPNPLFIQNGVVRDKSLVFFLGIVGVPWQDLQVGADESGVPYPSGELHFQTGAQLEASGAWDTILGVTNPPNDTAPLAPTDTLMQESIRPRTGNDGENPPQALVDVSGPQFGKPGANAANGHEWNDVALDDLQYACIFPLGTPKNCADPSILDQFPAPGCDCKTVPPGRNSPLCQASDDSYTTTQSFAKAYPGLRHLEVAKGLGNNGLVSSICARNLTDATKQDYGYGPAIDLLLGQLKSATQ
jgi:hypothetical protein